MSAVEANALAHLTEHLVEPPWTTAALQAAAHEAPHVSIGIRNRPLVTADAALNLAYWRVLAVVSPLGPNGKFGVIYEHVKSALMRDMQLQEDEVRIPARKIARFLFVEAGAGNRNSREPIPVDIRPELYELSAGRCWYCGDLFGDLAVEQFLDKPRDSRPQVDVRPRYVDFVTGRGASLRDVLIEIDHVAPLSRRGSNSVENLRLACGWCNRHKGARSILYDANSLPIPFFHPELGSVYLPQPFWVVRTLGTQRRCDELGCGAKIEYSRLFIAPSNSIGAMVPGNLGIFCSDHDPLSGERLIARHLVKQ